MAIDSEENKGLGQFRTRKQEPGVLLTANCSLCRMEGNSWGGPKPVRMDGNTEVGKESQAGRAGSPKFCFN